MPQLAHTKRSRLSPGGMLRLTPWPQTEQNFIGRGQERVIGVYHWGAVLLRRGKGGVRELAVSGLYAKGCDGDNRQRKGIFDSGCRISFARALIRGREWCCG
ncbi:protein of unknown function [Paraburkholderia dioscoreae]|uniref:Uncharacterized protein n=1 Tax=Paraburkholderia dioscoreae TaxID=2604047 RepID=A0A5Q4ZCN9_9BURK|nr:protein of unknown function [Paraburkholderia dioscoreae]